MSAIMSKLVLKVCKFMQNMCKFFQNVCKFLQNVCKKMYKLFQKLITVLVVFLEQPLHIADKVITYCLATLYVQIFPPTMQPMLCRYLQAEEEGPAGRGLQPLPHHRQTPPARRQSQAVCRPGHLPLLGAGGWKTEAVREEAETIRL